MGEFEMPKLRITDWGQDIVSQENNMMLLPCKDFEGKQLKDIVDDVKVPIILFTSQCWQEIQYLTNKYQNQEWAVFLTMKKLSELQPHFLAFDWFMPDQKATGGDVSVDAESAKQYYKYLEEHYPYYKRNGLHKFLCHLHSHHSMSLSNFSSIDDAQQFGRDDLGFYDTYRFYIVVTTNSVKASLVIYNPVAVRVNAAVGIAYNNPKYVVPLTKDRKNAIDAICDKVIKKPTASKWAPTYSWDSLLHGHGTPSTNVPSALPTTPSNVKSVPGYAIFEPSVPNVPAEPVEIEKSSQISLLTIDELMDILSEVLDTPKYANDDKTKTTLSNEQLDAAIKFSDKLRVPLSRTHIIVSFFEMWKDSLTQAEIEYALVKMCSALEANTYGKLKGLLMDDDFALGDDVLEILSSAKSPSDKAADLIYIWFGDEEYTEVAGNGLQIDNNLGVQYGTGK